MTNLVISNQAISTHNGLFSLNDLHKVSGNAKRHQPSDFLRNQQTKDLIHEIESENTIAYHTINGGKNRGTYACEELVYAYAMWISAKFNLMVIRAFKALNTGAIPCLARHTLSTAQQVQIQKCVRQKCKDNSTHYQTIYTALKDKFKVPSCKDILASEFDEALAFIVGFDFTDNDHNAFWRMVGLLEHARISDEIDRLNDTINQAERFINQARRQITHLNKTTGLLYDAFGEQRLPTKADVVSEAKVFITKQMAFKRQIGMI